MRTDGIEEDEFKHLEEQFGGKIPGLKVLTPLLKQKVALIFTDASVYDLKGKIEANKIPTEARIGVVSPIDFSVPAGPTGLDPSQINFFHALNISTKIVKGQIEITKDFKVCTKDKKVKASEAALLKKLNFKPFEYGMKVHSVYDDGAILPEEVLTLDPASLLTKFQTGAKNILGLSLSTGITISATIPLIIGNAFKNIAALSLESGYIIFYLDIRLRNSKTWELLLLLLRPSQKSNKRQNKRRRRRKRRKLLPLPLLLRKKTWIWATSSADRI